MEKPGEITVFGPGLAVQLGTFSHSNLILGRVLVEELVLTIVHCPAASAFLQRENVAPESVVVHMVSALVVKELLLKQVSITMFSVPHQIKGVIECMFQPFELGV